MTRINTLLLFQRTNLGKLALWRVFEAMEVVLWTTGPVVLWLGRSRCSTRRKSRCPVPLAATGRSAGP